jgi:hypothetical protein
MSKANTNMVAGIVREKPELIGELWQIYFSIEEPVSRHAAWVLDGLTENHPERLTPYLPRLLELLPGFNHDGLKRHAVHMISRIRIPAEGRETLLNICFDWLVSRTEAVAVKVHCMEILYQICLDEPVLKNELIDSIEFILEEGTPGIKSHGRKILQKLYTISS